MTADHRAWPGRAAGVMLPLFSMPSTRSWGIGEFADVVAVARWMRDAGLRVLQTLPLNEMAPGQGSPYSAISAMALDPVFISAPLIPDFRAIGGENALDSAERGLLERVRANPGVDYAGVRTLKDRVFRAAFRQFARHEWAHDTDRAAELRAFISGQAWWLDEYALFRAAYHLSGGLAWSAWSPGVRDRDLTALSRVRRESAQEMLYRQYLQWIAHTQWSDTRALAAPVRLAGDFPFGVAADSADAWADQDLFSFEAAVGAPPDAFSEEGQNWQLPVYRWDVMRERDYEWFRARARRTADLFDLFRVDHVVGLFRTWIFPCDGRPPRFEPSEEAEQTRQGEAVLRAVIGTGAAVIAEDLGTIPEYVRAALRAQHVPGYRVMRWERNWKEAGRPFLDPAQYPPASVATSGTHDTETLAAWWRDADEGERVAILAAVETRAEKKGMSPRPASPFVPAIRDALLESLYASGSDLLVLPVQDIFGWTDRINVPATVGDSNWIWKLPWPVDRMDGQPEAAERQQTLRRWAERHRRL